MKRPREIIEDVLIKVDKFYFPMDFIVIDTVPVLDVMNQILVILGRPFLAMVNALINCRTGVIKISFGNMIVELNIFNINKQPPKYDEAHPMYLIEEITSEIVSGFGLEGPEIECFTQEENDLDFERLIGQDDFYETSLEDPEMECFAPFGGDLDLGLLLQQAESLHEPSLEDPEIECFFQCGGNIDFYRLLEPTRVVVEPSIEEFELESFAQLRDDEYFDEVVELLKSIFDPISKIQHECGETIELLFSTTYSSTVEPPDFISESKWVAPIYRWTRWPRLIMGRNDHFPPPFYDIQMKGLAEYFFVLIDYSNYENYPFDPGK
jgi:hypothetical protein